MFQAKQFYLEQLKKGPMKHRSIMKRMAGRFDDSPAEVRDELLKDGLIVAVSYSLIKGTNKRNYVYQLTNISEKMIKVDRWPCGQVKSKGNAFDWRNKDQSLYTKREIVQAQQVYKGNNQVIVYSRA